MLKNKSFQGVLSLVNETTITIETTMKITIKITITIEITITITITNRWIDQCDGSAYVVAGRIYKQQLTQ